MFRNKISRGLLDENLSWKPHIEYLRKKLSQSVKIIAKMRKYLDNTNLVALYYSFFFSHILYGILGWGSATKSAIISHQTLQNKVLKIINKSTWKDHIDNNKLFHEFQILKISDIYKFELSKFMYSYHVKAFPAIFDSYFLPIAEAHNYNTRSKPNQNYFLNFVNSNSGKNSIKFYGVQLWNLIPPEIKSYSFYRFKKEYKKILLNNYK